MLVAPLVPVGAGKIMLAPHPIEILAQRRRKPAAEDIAKSHASDRGDQQNDEY